MERVSHEPVDSGYNDIIEVARPGRKLGALGDPGEGANASGPLGGTTRLDSQLSSRFSQAYGQDLGDVRVHPDSAAAEALHVRAFTVGQDIAFSPGEYQPETTAGQLLLGHELAHVVQQSRGAEGLQGEGLRADRYEQEADTAASAVLAEEPVPGLSPAPGATPQFAPPASPPPASGGPAQPPATHAALDLSGGTIDPASVQEGGQYPVHIDSLGATGVIELVKNRAGDKVSSKGQGHAITLGLAALKYLHPDPLVLVVRVQDNSVTGHVAVGEPGPFIKQNDVKLFGVLCETPASLGFLGLTQVRAPKPDNRFEGGQLHVGAGLELTLGGWVSGAKLAFDIDNDQIKVGGSAKVDVTGAQQAELTVEWTPEAGLSGSATLVVGMGPVKGEGAARLHDGVVDAQATVAYESERLNGSLTLLAIDAETARDITKSVGPDGAMPSIFDAPAAEAGPGAKPNAAKPAKGPRAFAGWGQLDFALNEWLTGRTLVVVNSEGKVTLVGKVTPPKEIVLFEQKDWVKELFKVEARAAYGLPVIGNVFVFANVGLEALATIGPGKLYDIELNGTYSTDERADQSLDLKASLNISAFAGLRLRAEGGAGVELLAHDIKAGVGVWALAGVRGYVDATPTIGMRQAAGKTPEYFIKGHMDLAAQMFLELGGDLFIEVDGPWWSPIDGEKWTWPLGSVTYPIPGEFGIGADVEHVLGSKTWPEVKFSDVAFDASKFTSDLLRERPPKDGGGEKQADTKWNDGAGGAGPTDAPGTANAVAPGGATTPAAPAPVASSEPARPPTHVPSETHDQGRKPGEADAALTKPGSPVSAAGPDKPTSGKHEMETPGKVEGPPASMPSTAARPEKHEASPTPPSTAAQPSQAAKPGEHAQFDPGAHDSTTSDAATGKEQKASTDPKSTEAAIEQGKKNAADKTDPQTSQEATDKDGKPAEGTPDTAEKQRVAAEAKSVSEALEQANTPASVIASSLERDFMPRYLWIKRFEAEVRSPELAEIFMIASKIKVDDVQRKVIPPELHVSEAVKSAANLSDDVKVFGRCIEFAKRLRKALITKGIPGVHIRLEAQGRRIGDMKHGRLVGDDVHEGILVGGTVFDNLNWHGVSLREWRGSLRLLREEDKEIPDNFFSFVPF